MTKHFYRLILRVEAGDSRRHDEWVVGTLPELSSFLEKEFSSPNGSYTALIVGQQMRVECWQDGSMVHQRGVGPALLLTIQGIDDPFTFEDDGDAFGPELDEDATDFLGEQLQTGAAKVKVRVNLGALGLPKLEGEPLREGETATLTSADGTSIPMAWGHRSVAG